MPESTADIRISPAQEHGVSAAWRPSRLLWVATAGAALLALLLAIAIARDAAPFDWDRAIMLALRQPGGPALPAGPEWLRGWMVAITALGDGTILTMVVAVTAGLLLIRRLWLTATLITIATVSGSWLAGQTKLVFARPRPDVVAHLVDVTGLSFPSGHAANSAIVYLTLAGLVSQIEHGRAVRRYTLAVAILLVGAIGISRVYLGVHWPSDVVAGWCLGTLWALGWWAIAARVRRGGTTHRTRAL